MQGGMKPERAESGISTEYRLALPVGSPQNAAVSLMLWRGHNSARNFPMSDGPQKPRVVDNPDVGELYANKTIGASFDGGGITVLLGCSRVIPELVDTPLERNEPPAVYVTGRLTLSPAAAVELMNALNGILAALSSTPNSPIAIGLESRPPMLTRWASGHEGSTSRLGPPS
jgi:hypothetical protein